MDNVSNRWIYYIMKFNIKQLLFLFEYYISGMYVVILLKLLFINAISIF